MKKSGSRGEIWTPDLRVMNPALSPTELPCQWKENTTFSHETPIQDKFFTKVPHRSYTGCMHFQSRIKSGMGCRPGLGGSNFWCPQGLTRKCLLPGTPDSVSGIPGRWISSRRRKVILEQRPGTLRGKFYSRTFWGKRHLPGPERVPHLWGWIPTGPVSWNRDTLQFRWKPGYSRRDVWKGNPTLKTEPLFPPERYPIWIPSNHTYPPDSSESMISLSARIIPS